MEFLISKRLFLFQQGLGLAIGLTLNFVFSKYLRTLVAKRVLQAISALVLIIAVILESEKTSGWLINVVNIAFIIVMIGLRKIKTPQ